jgi:hypothetical protein
MQQWAIWLDEPAPAEVIPLATRRSWPHWTAWRSRKRSMADVRATLPLGSVAVEAEANERGERLIWLEAAKADRLGAMQGPGESYSDVILWQAASGSLTAEDRDNFCSTVLERGTRASLPQLLTVDRNRRPATQARKVVITMFANVRTTVSTTN